MLRFKHSRLTRFRFQVRINLRLICMVVGKGRVDLRQAQMAKLLRDLFRD